MRTRTQYLKVECQWRIQGGFLWFRGTPFLSFCVRASPASCARTSAVENVLDSGTPPFKILDPPLQPNTIHHCDCACGYILLGESRNRLTLTEVGTMNIFVHWINEDGDPEIATPPLCGTILPGVTRMSLLELAATWGSHKVVERTITMDDVRKAVKENRLKEMFGAGTACVVCPVNKIAFLDEHLTIPTMESGAEVAQRCLKELTDIQYGHVDHEWAVVID